MNLEYKKYFNLLIVLVGIIVLSNVLVIFFAKDPDVLRAGRILFDLIYLGWFAYIGILSSKDVILNFKNNTLSLEGAIISVLITYLSAIVLFGLLYYMLAKAGIFRFHTDNSGVLTYIYFSTMTITTVGFGDIYPTCALSKCAVCLEVLSGIMFTTVFLATLSAYILKRIIPPNN